MLLRHPSHKTGPSLVAQTVKNLPARQETPVQSLGEGDGLPTLVFLDFPGSSDSKESACNAGNLGSIPGSERFPGEGKMDNVCLSISVISSI